MNCPACGFENEATHKFCAECGTKLVSACPNCGSQASPGHKFCPDCGTALTPVAGVPATAPTQVRPVEERRVVTALFCDLVGFTSFSESRDPEQVRAMLTRYFDLARATIEKFGGVVDKFIGDAVTAFWGATIAQADDPERAVRAALDLVDAVAGLGEEIGVPDLTLRAGVLTGETAVGPGGNEKGLVLGDVVNTASRLQSIAEPGTVAVGDSTKLVTEGAIAYEDLGVKPLKGKESGVRVWRAMRVASARGGRGRSDALEPPFVGREHELRMLKDLLEVTGREQRARLVSIIGDGGIGKSRLAWEFQKYVDGLVEPVYWHQGRSPAYGDGLTFWSLSEMIRRRAGITESDESQRARTRLRTAVVEYVTNPEEQRWIEPRLAGLLGFEEMPAGDRTELYAAIRTYFQRIAERGTTVLVFEDLHWADAGVITFIEELIDRSPRHPLLVIALARPELLVDADGWVSGRRLQTSVNLGPIADSAMADLVGGTVPGLSADLVTSIVDRAGGVPLYAVEMIRTLINDGKLVAAGDGTYRIEGDVATISVPDSLQSVIGARLDALDPSLRALVKDAAVLGQSFAVEGLSVVTSKSPDDLAVPLTDLVRAEVLRLEDDPRSPERGQYQFVQSLIREVAYGRLTLAERKSRHLAVAAYFEGVEDIEVAGVVASHLLDAHRAEPDASDSAALSNRAIEALTKAARRAADLHSHKQVVSLVTKALDIATDDLVRGELLLMLARGLSGEVRPEEAIERAEEAKAAFERAGDDEGVLRAITFIGRTHGDRWQVLDAVQVLEPAFAEHSSPQTSVELALAGALSRAYMMVGRDHEAIEVADAALPIAEALDDLPHVVDLMITKGTALGDVRRPREGLSILRGALAIAEANEFTLAALRAHNNLGVLLAQDDPAEGVLNTEAALGKAKALGDPYWHNNYTAARIADLINARRVDEARTLNDELDPAEIPDQWKAALDYHWGRLEMIQGDAAAGFERASKALSYWEGSQDPGIRAIWSHLHAHLALLKGDFAAAYDRAIAIPRDHPYPTELEIAFLAAAHLRDMDRLAEVSQRLLALDEKGRMIAALRLLGAGVEAYVAGRLSEAGASIRQVLESVSVVSNPDYIATLQAAVAGLLGLEDALGQEAGRAAKLFYEESGDVNLLALYADALPAGDQGEAGTG